MKSLNKAMLIGNLGKDPEMKYTTSGKAVCNFSIATTDTYNGEDHTTWHNIVAWGKLAEICGEWLKKGARVYLEGKIQNRSYDDKNGAKRYVSEVVAFDMVMLGGVERTETAEPEARVSQSSPIDDDLPF